MSDTPRRHSPLPDAIVGFFCRTSHHRDALRHYGIRDQTFDRQPKRRRFSVGVQILLRDSAGDLAHTLLIEPRRDEVRSRALNADRGEFIRPDAKITHPATSAQRVNQSPRLKMNRSDLVSDLVFWFHRLDAYLLTHVIDDPAWLALMFC